MDAYEVLNSSASAESSAKYTIIETDTLHQLDAAPPLIQQNPIRRPRGQLGCGVSQRLQLRCTRCHVVTVVGPTVVASQRKEAIDLPSEQPVSETLMGRTSRLKSVANAAMIAAFSVPQVKCASTVKSPWRLAASDESGKDSVSLEMLGNTKCCHKPDVERSVTQQSQKQQPKDA